MFASKISVHLSREVRKQLRGTPRTESMAEARCPRLRRE